MTAGQLPFPMLFLSFLLTFVTSRTITRMIRAGVGPFRNNIAGGVHIHHAVPGIILTLVGAYTAVGVGGRHLWAEVSCVREGKYSTAVLGVFLPPVAWIGAVRLARPGSIWARRYDAARTARAKARAAGFDARFGPLGPGHRRPGGGSPFVAQPGAAGRKAVIPAGPQKTWNRHATIGRNTDRRGDAHMGSNTDVRVDGRV